MPPAIALTSVPSWAVEPSRPPADVTGRSWTIVALVDGHGDARAAEIAADWTTQLRDRHPDAAPRVHLVSDDDAARRAVSADLADARVGWRLMIAGPADACLRLRAHAVRSDVADDEITVASTDVAYRDVHCAHCRTVTRAAVDLGGVVACSGCGLELVVYYHVSRRIGAHLGFIADTGDGQALS